MSVRKSNLKLRVSYSSDGWMRLAILTAAFFAGALCGFFFSVLGGEHQELSEHLTSYFQTLAQSGSGDVSVLSAAWDVFRWPVLSFLFGFTALGVAGIPILLTIRGFLLAYSTTAFVQMFGMEGLAVGAVLFGVSALLVVPVTFAVSAHSFHGALLRRFGADEIPHFAGALISVAPCIGLLVLALVLQCCVLPAVLPAICGQLF